MRFTSLRQILLFVLVLVFIFLMILMATDEPAPVQQNLPTVQSFIS